MPGSNLRFADGYVWSKFSLFFVVVLEDYPVSFLRIGNNIILYDTAVFEYVAMR